MEYRNRGNNQHQASHNHHSSNYSYFAEQARGGASHFSGYMDPQLGQSPGEFFIDHHHHHHHPHPNPDPHAHPLSHPQFYPPPHFDAVHEIIQREIEKQRIREEIIISEIARRRALEAEVRRELMMERELALQRVGDGFSFGSPPQTGFDRPKRLAITGTSFEERVLEERFGMSEDEMRRLNGARESGGFETLPFQRRAVDLRVSEIKPVSEGGKEKVILLAKPNENISGSKRKASTPPRPDASETPLHELLKIKAKEEWSCALCKVNATCERGLNEHLKGKRHKSKEKALRAQRAGKNYSIGLLPKKATKFSKAEDNMEFTIETLMLQKKSEPELVEKLQKNDEQNKKKHNFWCEICKVGTLTLKTMNIHKRGKKHARRVEKNNQNGGSHPKKIEILVNHSKCDDVDVSNVVSEHIDETSDETRVEVDEPENREVVDECTAVMDGIKEDRTPVDIAKPEDEPIADVIESKDGD